MNLAEDLPAVEHERRVGDGQVDGHAAHQHEPSVALETHQRRERGARVAGAADHVEGAMRAAVGSRPDRIRVRRDLAGQRDRPNARASGGRDSLER
jgi:hypothetical protein